MSVTDALAQADAQLDHSLERLFELIRIPSISTDPAYKDDCRAAADWLVAELTDMGFEAKRHDTTGQPMVVARHEAPGPHLLFYGHYDVQPADPLELWNRPPFDPAIEDTPHGKVIRARGANDDKGQLMTFVEAMRAWKATTGSLPGNLTLFFEGEEECGSPSLIPFLESHKDLLAADLAMICDTGMFDRDTPAITTMLRGLSGIELTVTGPNRDLHSGAYGGPAINPLRVLSRMLADLHDDNGRVTLEGFYDGVDPVPAEVQASWDALGFDEAAFLGEVDLSETAGEKGYTALQQVWSRPTAEINGLWGGYTGAGFKTVLPSQAHAKVSFRLVGRQDPNAVAKAFEAHLRARLPKDCTLDFRYGHGAPATVMPTERPEFKFAQTALTEEWGREAAFVGSGGSIPVAGHFKEILGIDSMLIGFGLEDDGLHSPNEKYNLSSFHKGIRSWVRILGTLTS